MLKLASAICWYESETLTAEELKKWGNAEFTKGNFEGNFVEINLKCIIYKFRCPWLL
jgi:hypothetical protein